jgi:5-methylcytosine-specific restriction enzyme A
LSFDSQFEGRKDDLIIDHLSNGLEILLFYRNKKNERVDYSFIYEDLFEYESHSGNNPVNFKLRRVSNLEKVVQRDLLCLKNEETGIEGDKKEKYSNYFERDQRLRYEAIKIHGTICSICGFDFEETYGDIGSGFIEVHHCRPLHLYNGPREVNPRTDLIVVCSNCHRMIHRNIDNVIEPLQLKQIISNKKIR